MFSNCALAEYVIVDMGLGDSACAALLSAFRKQPEKVASNSVSGAKPVNGIQLLPYSWRRNRLLAFLSFDSFVCQQLPCSGRCIGVWIMNGRKLDLVSCHRRSVFVSIRTASVFLAAGLVQCRCRFAISMPSLPSRQPSVAESSRPNFGRIPMKGLA